MKQIYKQLGKVRPTVEDDWSIDKTYTLLSIVYDKVGNASYISRKDVPAGIQITNKEYWTRFSNTRVNSDSIVLLSKIQDDGLINSYDLQEAIDSFKVEDRRLGTFISFYEKPIGESTDYRWNLYQFNSNNIDDWNNTKYWQSIYYIQNKFLGLFSSEESLKRTRPFPIIGDYAFIGATLKEAVVYRCNNIGVWTRTNEKAKDYLSINLKGNITISEEGNWIIDGVDTGISSKGENGKTPLLRIKDYKWQVSYDGGIIYKDIPNSPIFVKEDDEDIIGDLQTDGVKLLKFADKEYNVDKFSGLGRVYLRKNIVNGKNVLTQEMINKSNTIYIIQYDYDLDNKEINVLENCILVFQGGTIKNGTIKFNNTIIKSYIPNIFININVTYDSRINCNINLSWFKFINDYSTYNYSLLQNLYRSIYNNKYNIIWDIESIYLDIAETNAIELKPNKIYDFNNTDIYVKGNKFYYLFDLDNTENIDTSYKKIEDAIKDDFFKNNQGLIHIEDKTPFYKRPGYEYFVYRKDMLLVQNNVLINTPILDYDNDDETDAEIKFIKLKSTTIKNANFIRYRENDNFPFILKINYIYNLNIENITVNSLNIYKSVDDEIININNSYNININNYTVNGTYSGIIGQGGYGYCMLFTNCTNVVLNNFNCNSNWHTFGNNSINNISIYNSRLNGFDCHSYGKDFYFKNCIFTNEYMAKPTLGYLIYENCKFINTRLINAGDTRICNFKIIIKVINCEINNTNLLFFFSNLNYEGTRRKILNKNELPDIELINTKINLENIDKFYFCNFTNNSNKYNGTLNISINGLTFNSNNINNVIYINSSNFVSTRLSINNINVEDNTKENNYIFEPVTTIINEQCELNNIRIPIVIKNKYDENLNIYNSIIKIIDNSQINYCFNCVIYAVKLMNKDYSIYANKVEKCKIVCLDANNNSTIFIATNDKANIIDRCSFLPASVYAVFKPDSYTEEEEEVYKNAISKCTFNTFLKYSYYEKDNSKHLQYYIINKPNLNQQEIDALIKFKSINNGIIYNDTKLKLNYFIDNKEVSEAEYKNKSFGLAAMSYSSDNRPAEVNQGYMIYDNTVKKPLWYNNNKWIDSNGDAADVIKKGTTAQRPTGVQIGFTYKDTDLNKWIIWNGEAWENIDGTALG